MYNIHLLPAAFGDSILIEYGPQGHPHFILIDGGPYYNFEDLRSALQKAAPDLRELELLVITHIDIDHIDGTVKLLNQSSLPFTIKEVWFNGRDQLAEASGSAGDDTLGSLQGEYLTKLIKAKGLPHNALFDGKAICIHDYSKLPEVTLPGGLQITLLSPGAAALTALIPVWDEELEGKDVEEKWEKDHRYADTLGNHIEELQETEPVADKGAANSSSIAFIARYEGKSCLFAADAPSDTLLAAIDPMLDTSGEDRLKVDAWKLAHHGSKKSTLDRIMEKIDCKEILVSSNGKRYKHPDEAVIAKLLQHNGPDLTFYFNYRTSFNEMWDKEDLKSTYNYKAIYPEDGKPPGITIHL
jgi:beta-lactamase superfamily II metal-dependent hydrolase